MSSPRTHEQIADDAIEMVRYGKEHARWMGALSTAICHMLEPGGRASLTASAGRARDLASLGQYLADDCANYLDVQAVDLQTQIEALEVSQ